LILSPTGCQIAPGVYISVFNLSGPTIDLGSRRRPEGYQVYNETIRKFGYPDTLLQEFDHWVVLLRPKQVTLGSLVLACKGEATRLGEVGPTAFSELAAVTSGLEAALERAFQPDRLNYLSLMMVDKHVHFHVLPRYASPRQALGADFVDQHWPKPPVLGDILKMDPAQHLALAGLLRQAWEDR